MPMVVIYEDPEPMNARYNGPAYWNRPTLWESLLRHVTQMFGMWW